MRSRATRQIRCVNMSLINLHDIYSQIFLRNSIWVAAEFRCGRCRHDWYFKNAQAFACQAGNIAHRKQYPNLVVSKLAFTIVSRVSSHILDVCLSWRDAKWKKTHLEFCCGEFVLEIINFDSPFRVGVKYQKDGINEHEKCSISRFLRQSQEKVAAFMFVNNFLLERSFYAGN